MTDRQIINDGVDVSGCEHYEDLNCFSYRDSCGYPLDCKDNPNCYYKQLKAKEQECEELQNKFLELNGKAYSNSLKLDQLKQTLTEIKEIARQEIVCDDCNFQGTYKCDSRLCTSFYLDDFCKNLLQKISEVLKNE